MKKEVPVYVNKREEIVAEIQGFHEEIQLYKSKIKQKEEAIRIGLLKFGKSKI